VSPYNKKRNEPGSRSCQSRGGTGRIPLAAEQILLFAFQDRGPESTEQRVAYSFPCSSTEGSVRCVVWNVSWMWSDPT
jgi:hypothetical protein